MICKLCDTTNNNEYECWKLHSGKTIVKVEIFLSKKSYSISYIGKVDDEMILEAKRFINTCVENYEKQKN